MADRTPEQQVAWDTLLGRPHAGVPTWFVNLMDRPAIDRLAGVPPGTYACEPRSTYRAMAEAFGTCMIDQWIPENPLSMGEAGYEAETERGATTGAGRIVRDGLEIDAPEAVVDHMERFAVPTLRARLDAFDEDATVREIAETERAAQKEIGSRMLKAPHGGVFPRLWIGAYGYEQYLMAYALYPEVMEMAFRLEGDLGERWSRAFVRAVREHDLPPYIRLDHDMADGRGTLVSLESLDRIWFPHFTRAVQPLVDGGIRCIWHCDGNLMEMVPRLLDAGLCGFQGFQYEHGMDYEAICRMRDRRGDPLLIIAGVSVTRTLPHGTPADVHREIDRLVEHGPRDSLFLGTSSSVAPGVPWENVEALREGFRRHARGRG